MCSRDHILQTLRQAREHLFSKYHLRSIALFGSYARDEQTEESDVDLLVDFEVTPGMEVVDLVLELEDLLRKRVDLVTPAALRPNVRPYVERDLVYV